ncbi:MAG: FG-GAP-like repeat-containing protein [Nannocystaceae bacterium]
MAMAPVLGPRPLAGRRLLGLWLLGSACGSTAAEPSAPAVDATDTTGSAPPSPLDEPATSSSGEPTTTSPDDGTASTGPSGSSSDDGTDESSSSGETPERGPPFELQTFDAPHMSVLGSRGPGNTWGDIDGDGWLDLVTVGGSLPTRVWHNQGDGSFALHDSTDDLLPYLQTVGANLVDYDGDGDPDLYLLRRVDNLLLRNDGGHFVDVSAATGLGDARSSSSSAWGDFDGDGRLDLYVANVGVESDALYHALPDGSYADVTELLPGRDRFQAYGVTFSDFDDDGDPDLYVANDKHVGNQAWRNDGPGCGGWCFTNVSVAWGANLAADSMGLAVGDYDEDGDLDLSITDNYTHHILRNDLDTGTMGFTDVSAEAGVIFDAFGWGTVLFDYDNDGWLDLYVADGKLEMGTTSRMFHNEGDGTFTDVTATCGCVAHGWSHGVTYADYDHDGALDLVVGNRGSRHDLYRNRDLGDAHWIEVELHGAGPVNRDAVGSRVWVTTTGGRTLMREVKLGSSIGSSNSLRLHFGLGSEQVQAIEIRWPDGLVQTPPPPATDGLWVHQHPGA